MTVPNTIAYDALSVQSILDGQMEQGDQQRLPSLLSKLLSDARPWLDNARHESEPQPYAHFRNLAERIYSLLTLWYPARRPTREGTWLVNEAAEILRRAERALSLSIIKAQDEGLVSSRDNPIARGGDQRVYNHRTHQMVVIGQRAVKNIRTISDFYPTRASNSGGSPGKDSRILAQFSDDDFDRAIAFVRSGPGLMSRAKLLRELEKTRERPTPSDFGSMLRDMSSRGYTSEQIADELGYSGEWVRRRANELKISIRGDKATARVKSTFDADRIVRETAIGLEGTVSALNLLDLSALKDDDELRQWTESIGRSLRVIGKVHRQLKEKVNGD